MRALMVTLAAVVGAGHAATSEPYPKHARPGECYVRVLEPQVRKTVVETVLVEPARTVVTTVPGACRDEARTETVRPAGVRTIETPATYKTITEAVTLRPAGVRTTVTPPILETVIAPVVIGQGPPTPAYAVDDGTPPDGGDPNAPPRGPRRICAEPGPLIYAPMAYTVVRVPAQVVRTPIPPVVAYQTRTVVDTPAHVDQVTIPEETRRVLAKVCAPSSTVTETYPERRETRQRTMVIKPPHYAWVRADCADAHPAPRPPPCPQACGAQGTSGPGAGSAERSQPAPVGDRRVRQLQDALAGRGYYQGPRDGLFTGQTVEAMDRFQRDHGLPEGRFTGETANLLGIAP